MKNLYGIPGRRPDLELEFYGTLGNEANGLFEIKGMRVIVSNGYGWEHVSVSYPKRTPTWAEMEWIRRLFFNDDETVMQLHVPVTEHISFHPHALHLWRPIDQEIPRPPGWMVGPNP